MAPRLRQWGVSSDLRLPCLGHVLDHLDRILPRRARGEAEGGGGLAMTNQFAVSGTAREPDE